MEPIAILIYRIIDIYFYIVIANVIISWLVAFNIINTYNQFVAMILYATRRLTDPLLNPIRRFLPNLGGVDISPIADCTKTDVWNMGGSLGVINEIIEAAPTDGLWDDSRNDESQLGLTYEQIEEAMNNPDSKYYDKYKKVREPNLHKMKPIPVCMIPKK